MTSTATAGLLKVSGNHSLSADHIGNVEFVRDNSTLDCNGHSIVFSSAPGATGANCGTGKCGISVVNRTYITIRNCTVSGAFLYGIYGYGAWWLNIWNSWIGGATSSGMRLIGGSQNVNVNTVDSVNNGEDGIFLRGLTNSSFTYTWSWQNALDGWEDGSTTDGGSNGLALVGGIAAFENGYNGIEIDGRAQDIFLDDTVTIYSNGQHGLSIDLSSDISIDGVQSWSNDPDPIGVATGGNGIRLQDVSNSTVMNGWFVANECDIFKRRSSTTQWTNNTFETECNANDR